MDETANSQKTNKPWQFQPGVSGNPNGRPKGTLKDYISKKFREMSDEDKENWLKENKIQPLDIWKMGEGNPAQGIGTDPSLEPVKLVVEVIHSNASNNANPGGV